MLSFFLQIKKNQCCADAHPPPMYLCPPSPTAADHESIYWKVIIPSLHQCISGPLIMIAFT